MSKDPAQDGLNWPNDGARQQRGMAASPKPKIPQVNPNIWLQLILPDGTVAFVPTAEWFETAQWWLRAGTAKKLGDGILEVDVRAAPPLCDVSAEAGQENCTSENINTIPGLRRPINPNWWIRLLLPGGTVAFLPTSEWEQVVGWWLAEGTAEKIGDGIVRAAPFAGHVEAIRRGYGFIDKSGPWVISRHYDAKLWGRG
jgi:hypothetical protein